MGEIIKINDWTLVKAEQGADPLLLDTEIAQKLGYTKPANIRKLIGRMVAAGHLERCSTVEQRPETGGKSFVAYYLTETQALKVIARSETDTASKILDEVIEVYLAYRKGLLVAAPPSDRRKPGPAPKYGERKVLLARVEPELASDFRLRCLQQGKSVSEGLEALIFESYRAPAVDPLVAQVLNQQTQLMQMMVSMLGAGQKAASLPAPSLPKQVAAGVPLQPDLLPADKELSWFWVSDLVRDWNISYSIFWSEYNRAGFRQSTKRQAKRNGRVSWQIREDAEGYLSTCFVPRC